MPHGSEDRDNSDEEYIEYESDPNDILDVVLGTQNCEVMYVPCTELGFISHLFDVKYIVYSTITISEQDI